ncbi:4839_t:CDS:2, partial [Rhizophagus irregularis]
TGTHIYVDTNKIPAQIKIYVNNKKEIPPFENRINDASSQLNDLLNKISQQENKKVDKIKRKKNFLYLRIELMMQNRINDASNRLNDSTKQISKQENKKIDKINKKKEIFLFENRINDTSNQLNDSTKQISKQGIDNINKKKEVPLFENRIGQLNDLINRFPIKKLIKIKKEVEVERLSKEVQHKSQELKKTLTKFVVNKIAKVADVAVVNDDLPEKFSRFSKNFKRKCKNKPKHKKMLDGMCWNGVDCIRKFCQFEHPS